MVFITKGNSKLKNIPIFSLPYEKTCINSTELCRKYCYAKKAWKQYPKVRETRNNNYEESKTKEFVKLMVKELLFMNVRYFRIHESGDFYSQEYLDKWFEIARQVKDIEFWAWTKSWNLDWSNKPDNMIVYWSIFPDSKNIPTSGKFAYISGDKKEFKYDIPVGYECPYPNKTCDKCMYCYNYKPDVMIFKLH